MTRPARRKWLTIPTRIVLGYIVVLVAFGVVGGLSFLQHHRTSQTLGLMVHGEDAAYGVEFSRSRISGGVFTPGGKAYRLICRSLKAPAAGADKAPKETKTKRGRTIGLEVSPAVRRILSAMKLQAGEGE